MLFTIFKTKTPRWKHLMRLGIEDKPKQLALSFAMAQAVSVPSPNPHDWIARKGEESLFQAFHQMLPEVRL